MIAAGPATFGVRDLSPGTPSEAHHALRFYQRRGFRLVEARRGVMTNGRRLKAAFPEIGDFAIAMRDELRLVRETAPG